MLGKQGAAGGSKNNEAVGAASLARPISLNPLAGKRNSGWTSALAVASLLASTASAALAQDAAGQGKTGGQLTNEQLLEKMERMEARIRSLEGELHRSKSEGAAANGSKTRVANTRKSGTKEASVQDQPVVPEIDAAGQKAACGGLERGTRARLHGSSGNRRA